MHCSRTLVLAAALLAANTSFAFESDVHFGLTGWLAMQAGFDEEAAMTIATGDQRVDSGDMPFLEYGLVTACLDKDERGASLTGEQHYPSAGKIPSPPEARTVVAGSDDARKLAVATIRIDPSQSQFMLLRLGEGLHELQDSWSHQGVPDVPAPAPGLFACDPGRAWGHPKARGGWNSHKADLTMYWPADTLAMAQATYELLLQYPPLAGAKRTPRPWEDLKPLVAQFAKASTKSAKSDWFIRQGITDVSFLEGISLADGTRPFVSTWPGRKLPPLEAPESRQHFLDADLLGFYNRFFEDWMSGTDFDALATRYGSPAGGHGPAGKAVPSSSRAELAARLKGWRIRDHGQVAAVIHSLKPLTPAERSTVDTVARKHGAFIVYQAVADAFFPFLPRTKDVSPLLPFFVRTWSEGGMVRAVAGAKFRHAPYDLVYVAAERTGSAWHVTSIGSTVEH